jgi:hypothetical protein
VDAAERSGPVGEYARPSGGRFLASSSPILTLCLCAVLVRALTTILLPNIVKPDETFQASEQALRLISGRGMTPWEFQVGARSWILPGLVLPLVAAGRALSADPRLTSGLIAALMIAASAANVCSAYVLGARSGRLQGLFAAGLGAFWCELVYYSPHLLPDTLSGALLLAGLAVGSEESPRRLFWAGVLFGEAFVVRVQLAPAIGLAGLMTCRSDFWRRGLLIAAGFAIPVAALGVLDRLTWGAPYRSILVYLRTNMGGVASRFGAEPPSAYLRAEKFFWGFAAPLVLANAVLGAKRAPGLTIIGAVIALTFSAAAHKELRFVYPALLILFVVCGIGSGELASALGRFVAPSVRRYIAPALAVLWAAASLGVAFGSGMRPLWTRDADILRAFEAVNADPASCGLGLDAPDWVVSGLTRLRSDLKLYDGAQTAPEAYNYLLTLPPGPRKPMAAHAAQGFALQSCFGGRGVCLYRRPGACSSGQPPLRAVTPEIVRAELTKLGFDVY